jgi:hypothetical protein
MGRRAADVVLLGELGAVFVLTLQRVISPDKL